MRILFLTSRFPYPLEKGDKLRAYHQIIELSRKHEIILVSVTDSKIGNESLEALKPYCRKILVHEISRFQTILNLIKTLFSSKPFQVGYFYSKSFQREVDDVIRQDKPTHVYCQLIRMAEYVKEKEGLIKILDYMDAFSKGYERMSYKMSWFKKWMVRTEWKRLVKYENVIFSFFDRHVIISEQDKKLIPHPEKEKIVVSPNGVDLNYYKPIVTEKKYDLIFSGNMSYEPNIESVLFLANEVMPVLLKQRPDIKLVIAGVNPSKEVLALQSRNIEVTGWVDDMREYYAASRICVAPMLISIGLQNKIIQAMAMEIPCVVTSLANNAIQASDGKSILIAETATQFAAQILVLLDNPIMSDSIAKEARDLVTYKFNWSQIVNELTKSFN